MANEQRLIDVNATIAEAEKRRNAHPKGSRARDCYNAVIGFIKYNSSPVDAVEVVHGRWEFDHTTTVEKYDVVKCSNCGHEAFAIAIYVKEGHYCPNCGAKMDGERKDNA